MKMDFPRAALLVSAMGVLASCSKNEEPPPPSTPSVPASTVPHRIFVTNEMSGDMTVIDGQTHQTLATVKLGKRPRGIQLSPDGTQLFVALSGSPVGGPDVDEDDLPPADKSADGIGVVDIASLSLLRVIRGVSDPEQLVVSH